jgi:ADP-ribosylation factor family
MEGRGRGYLDVRANADWEGTGTQGLIFVIDSSDRDRIDEARQELHRIINDREMKESLLLVFANKQDVAGGAYTPPLSLSSARVPNNKLTRLPTAMKPQEVTDALKLSQLKDKIWYVVPSCATTGEGLLEGLVSAPSNSPPSPALGTVSNFHLLAGMALQQREIPSRTEQEIDRIDETRRDLSAMNKTE